MYIHALRGRYSANVSEQKESDLFLAGHVGLLDRLAIARLTATSRTARMQNFVLYPLLFILNGCFWWIALRYIPFFAAINWHWTETSGVASFVVFMGLLINVASLVFFTAWDSESAESSSPRFTTTRIADRILVRRRFFSKLIALDGSRAMRALATGTCKSSHNRCEDYRAVVIWLTEYREERGSISRFLMNKWVREVERLIDARPAMPTEEDIVQVAKLKQCLDDRASAKKAEITARVEARVLAREAKQVDMTKDSATKWRAESARLTGDV